MKLRAIFGKNVRRYRQALGLTQEELSERLEVSGKTIGKIERGQAATSFGTAERIAKALSVDPTILFGADPAKGAVGRRGRLLTKIESLLMSMTEDQLDRTVDIVDFLLNSTRDKGK